VTLACTIDQATEVRLGLEASTGDYTQAGIFTAAWSSQSSHSTLFISR
jgi:hypothetical protein